MAGHAFISYVREDADVVDRIERALEYAGIDVWRDVKDIPPGEDWRVAVRDAIRSGSLAFVACFSSTSVAAGNSGQREELDLALALHGAEGLDHSWLIPVRLDDCDVPGLPFGSKGKLTDRQYIDLFGGAWDRGISRLVERVQELLLPEVGPAQAWWWMPEQAIVRGTARGRRWPGGLPDRGYHVLSGHPGGVRSMQAIPTPDGMQLAVGAYETVRLWDPEAGQPVREWAVAPISVVHAACTVPVADRVLLATTGSSDGIRLWDPSTGSAWGQPFGQTDLVHEHRRLCSVPLPDGRVILASGGSYHDPRVWLWDPASGRSVGEPLVGHTKPVTCLCAVPVGDRVLLASGAEDSTVLLWDLATAQRYEQGSWRNGVAVEGGVYDVCALPVEERIVVAIAGGKGRVALHDALGGWQFGETLWGHQGPVLAVCAVPIAERALLATAGHGQAVRLWDPASGAAVGLPLMGHAGWVTALKVVPVGGRMVLASGALDGSVLLWRPSDKPPEPRAASRHRETDDVRLLGGRCIEPRADGPYRLEALPQRQVAVLHGHTNGVLQVCAVPLDDGQTLLASSGLDHTVRFWDLTTGQPHGEAITAHDGFVGTLCVVRLGHEARLASADWGVPPGGVATIRIWDPASATPIGRPIVTDGVVRLCAVPLGEHSLLAAADASGTVRIWDPASARQHGPPIVVSPPLVGLATVTTGTTTAIATTSRVSGIQLWDPNDGRLVGPRFRTGRLRRPAHDRLGGVWILPMNEGAMLAAASHPATVGLWDIRSGRPTHRIELRDATELSCLRPVLLGDDTLLGGGGTDGSVRFWRLDDGEPIGIPLQGHTQVVRYMCAVPLGRTALLATASADTTLRLWGPGEPGESGASIPGPPPAAGSSFEDRQRSETEDRAGRAHLRGDIIVWLQAFGQHKAFDTPSWDGMGSTIAALYRLWSPRPAELIEELARITLPVDGWAVYGAHRLIDEIASDQPLDRTYRQLLSAAFRFADNQNIGLLPWELSYKRRLESNDDD